MRTRGRLILGAIGLLSWVAGGIAAFVSNNGGALLHWSLAECSQVQWQQSDGGRPALPCRGMKWHGITSIRRLTTRSRWYRTSARRLSDLWWRREARGASGQPSGWAQKAIRRRHQVTSAYPPVARQQAVRAG